MLVLTCKTCGERKLETLFYKQVGTTRGRNLHCIECVKARVHRYRSENLEYVREYDRERGQLERRKAANRMRTHLYHRNSREWRSRNPEKYQAHVIFNNALRDGLVKRDSNCNRCGGEHMLEAHHEDYAKPLEVLWLCKGCHMGHHRKLNAERRRTMAEAAE